MENKVSFNKTTGFNKLILAFYHNQADSSEVINKVAASLIRNMYYEDLITIDDLKNACITCHNSSPIESIMVMMEFNAVEFAGSSYEFLDDLIDSIPEISAVVAMDFGQLLTVPPMAIRGSKIQEENKVTLDIKDLVHSIGCEIVGRITASAELTMPDIRFIHV